MVDNVRILISFHFVLSLLQTKSILFQLVATMKEGIPIPCSQPNLHEMTLEMIFRNGMRITIIGIHKIQQQSRIEIKLFHLFFFFAFFSVNVSVIN